MKLAKILMPGIQQELQRALDLLFPPTCAGCKRTGAVLCSSCLAKLQPSLASRCRHCHSLLSANSLCSACRWHLLRVSGLRAVGSYQGILRSCIHDLKYGGQVRLAAPLGKLLAQAYALYRLRADIIVPVPLHKERERQRGYNHAALLARACSYHTGVPVSEGILQRQRATTAQVGLDMHMRLTNVAGAFRCWPAYTNGQLVRRSLLLIDDVCTTGATLEACAAPLFAAGAKSVWGLVLARSS